MSRFDRRAIWLLHSVALSGAVGLAAQAPAWAQSSQGEQPSAAALEAAKTACASDLQQLCANVKPGGGRILACLKQHRDQVSPACKQAVISALGGSGAGTSGDAGGGASPPAPAPAPASSPSSAAPAAPVASASAATAQTSTAGGAKAVAHAGGAAPRTFTLKRMRASLKDGDKETMPVFTLLAPENWALVGGFLNKTDAGSCFSDMIQVQGAVKTDDGAYGMGVVPRSSFRWADDPAVRQQMEQRDKFDSKFKLADCPIKAPMHAADFLRENLVWKFHKDKPQVTAEPFPELEQLVRAQLGLGSQSGGARGGSTRVEVARVRTSATTQKGDAIDEWWSGAIVVRTFPVPGRGLGYEWHAEQVTVFQTPKGQLDGYDKLYRVMATSVRLDPKFQSWSGDLIGNLYVRRGEELQKQNQIVADFQRHVAETLQGVTANAQRGSLQAGAGADQLVRGVQTFRDPSSGRTVELSNLYDHAWSNGNDRYIVSDDPNFNPNGHLNGDWGELQLVRPQP